LASDEARGAMKVASVAAFPVAYPEPNDDGATRSLCLVRLESDDGAVGWGEACTLWPEASLATAELVRGLADLVIGSDPAEVGETWERLRSHTWWYGDGGLACFAIAALDIALWDLRGKALGLPLVEMLGGACRGRLPALASGHATLGDLDALVAETASWVPGRAQGVKVGFGKRGEANLGFEYDRDVAYVAGLRQALGPGPKIMVDCGVKVRWTPEQAIERTLAFEEHGLDWIEEPLGHDDPAGYAALRQAVATRIAYGEREWNLRGLAGVIDSGTCDVVGIDPGRAEGISGFVAACHLAERAGVTTNAHAWTSGIVLAASLAVSWTMPSCELLEVQPFVNPMVGDLIVGGAPQPSDGWWPRPHGHGLGIEVDESVVAAYALTR
jgi:L-alanine-DL-glutamate epimerase-like enolase superfamily enzyme